MQKLCCDSDFLFTCRAVTNGNLLTHYTCLFFNKNNRSVIAKSLALLLHLKCLAVFSQQSFFELLLTWCTDSIFNMLDDGQAALAQYTVCIMRVVILMRDVKISHFPPCISLWPLFTLQKPGLNLTLKWFRLLEKERSRESLIPWLKVFTWWL